MNPACRKELHYLRNGRVIRTTRRIGAQVQVEHFWLCGECHLDYDFLFANDGRVSLTLERLGRLSNEGHGFSRAVKACLLDGFSR